MMMMTNFTNEQKARLLNSVHAAYVKHDEKENRLHDISGRLAKLFIECEIDTRYQEKVLAAQLEKVILSGEWAGIGICLDMIMLAGYNDIIASDEQKDAAQDLDRDIQDFIFDYDIIPADF